MKTKAVIYARVSSVNDRQDTTRQIEDLKRYALLQDIEIVRIFQEHISGAKKIEERQVLAECLEYCTEKGVDYLLLSELSRLGRSTLQVLRSLEILHEAKVSVYIQNLGLYTLQPNIAKGGKLGRKAGSIKTEERKREEYRETIALLKKGYSVRNIAKLQGIGVSTVQRIRSQFIK